jgi:3'-phosphoadenosine 5'-phosphosulfate sulfotransferase (PAPS reductase)/FAD synthetase
VIDLAPIGIEGNTGAIMTHAAATPMTGAQTIAAVRSLTPVALLSFSRGKDSIASYLAIRDHFERVVPYTMYFVPNLEFVEESLQYYEHKMGCHIIRLPSPSLYRMLRNRVYQPPDMLAVVDAMNLPDVDHNFVQESVVLGANLPADAPVPYNAIGVRSKDSVQRAMIVQRNGSINHTRHTFYPIVDWSKQQVIDAIAHAGWKLPVDYRYFSASFDGLYLKYLLPIKKHFPRDYQRICDFYPLAELEVLRYEASGQA